MTFGFPALLDKPSGCATRPDSQQKPLAIAELKQCSPKTLGLSALLGMAAGDESQRPKLSGLSFRRMPESRTQLDAWEQLNLDQQRGCDLAAF